MEIKVPMIMKLETAYNLGILKKRFFKISGKITQCVGLFEPGDDGKVYGVFKIFVGAKEKKERIYYFNGTALLQEVDFIAIPADTEITIKEGDGTSLLPHIIKY